MTRVGPAAARPPDYEREHHAVALLVQAIADNPGSVLHALVNVAREICDARSAGVNLFDDGRVAATPDGAMQVPLHDHGTPIGTLWIAGHSVDLPFDAEDARIVGVLTTLASAGWGLWQASDVMAADGRRKDDFLATLAHELRNPLSAIAAAAAVLQQRTQPPSVSLAVGVIARQTQHMSRLIADLLDIARIVRGKLELETQTIDLRTVVAEAIDTRRAQIERRQQTLTVEVGATPAMISGDPVRLTQVISNLLDNAAKYTPEHGTITVTVACQETECSVAVRDSGAGIPAKDVDRIFLPFTQLLKDGPAVEGGLGLGLALVRRLAALHGGSVSVDSAGPGHGSCFIVRLPNAS